MRCIDAQTEKKGAIAMQLPLILNWRLPGKKFLNETEH